MLTVADGKHAASVRANFTRTILGDWSKILSFASHHQLVSSSHSQMLSEGLQQIVGARRPVSSELIHYYFQALDALQRKDKQAAAQAITWLGNVLVQYGAEGRMSGQVPVHVAADAGVGLPAARPNYRLPMAHRDALVDLSEIHSRGEEVSRSIQETWISKPSDALGIRGATSPVAFEVKKYNERTLALSGVDPHLRLLESDRDGKAVVERLHAAFRLVESVDAEQAAEISAVTEYVVPLRGSGFVGGSDIFLYGATFLRMQPEWSELCYADHLVHEAAHQLLHAEQELDPLLLNRDQTGQPSPIRSDPRPLYGSFHATFVFLRLSLFMKEALQNGSPELAPEAEIRLHRHLLGLLQGLQIMVDYGEFSQRGRQVLDGWIEEAHMLRAFAGTPDPRKYGLLDWDYEPANSGLQLFAA
ncbi:aKG-HExxH-type peptide beta-hydroxylase [Streptomyces sp. NPDC002952]|uniref:aKG-HExxH-type peptide beta-hydroxylase n=1 Tax=Streptomyces sp. NPDC002952 TaxID=3364673 RepID=UPI00368CD7F9